MRAAAATLLRAGARAAAPRTAAAAAAAPATFRPAVLAPVRGLAKKKGKKAAVAASAAGDDAEAVDYGAEATARMEAALAGLETEYATLRGGKADPAMFDGVLVEAYGSSVPLNTVAQVALKSPTLASVAVFVRAVPQRRSAACVARSRRPAHPSPTTTRTRSCRRPSRRASRPPLSSSTRWPTGPP